MTIINLLRDEGWEVVVFGIENFDVHGCSYVRWYESSCIISTGLAGNNLFENMLKYVAYA